MKSFRVTLISDPTDEYPQNKNNALKVRLPGRLDLEGHRWQASLWSVSVPDVGHSSSVIDSDKDTKILQYRYTLTKRYAVSRDWLVNFEAKDKSVTLKDVMSTSYPVLSGQQLWQNILTHMEQTMMDDVKSSSDTWRTAKGNTATVSLKSTWKPTFEWRDNILVLKKVGRQDVFGRDDHLRNQALSSLDIHVNFAEKCGLLYKDKQNQYQLGPNLMYTLATVTYSTDTPPVRTNDRYQWVGEHFVGMKPRDVGGNALFNVKQVDGQSYLYLSRTVDWYFQNLNALFNQQVGTVKQSVMIYCDVVESTMVGAQRHSLLRKVELERKGEGRVNIEPFHREWIKVRNQHIESIEVSLATPSGSLLVLSPGKTIVTLGFQQV